MQVLDGPATADRANEIREARGAYWQACP
jgi:hypothetical protein